MKAKEFIVGIWFAVSLVLLSIDTENLWILAAVTANFVLSGYAASKVCKLNKNKDGRI